VKRADRESKMLTARRRESDYVADAAAARKANPPRTLPRFGKWLRSKFGETVLDRHEGANKDGTSKGGKR
jgi:hypothetical protein